MSVESICTPRCLISHGNLERGFFSRWQEIQAQFLTSPSELHVCTESDECLLNTQKLWVWLSPLALPNSSMRFGMCSKRWRHASFSHAPMHIKYPCSGPWVDYSSGVVVSPQLAEDVMIIHPSFIVAEDQTESKQAKWRRCCIQSG